MQNKLVLVFIIIFMVGIFLPSYLVQAEEEPPETPPDRTYDFSNAPFPGENGYLTESRWETFLGKAKEYQHQVIYEYLGFTIEWEGKEPTLSTKRVFFSAPLDGFDDYLEVSPLGNTGYISYDYRIKIDDNVEVNKIPIDGMNIDIPDLDWSFGSSSREIISTDYHMHTYYIADLEDDPYQEEPEMYNIDPQRSYGMYFIKPEYGEWINVPHAMGVWKDEIKLRVQIPREIETSYAGIMETYTVSGLWDKAVDLNIAIRITNTNADGYQQYADKVLGSADSWILPGKMEIINLVENGETVQLEASLPMDYTMPKDGGTSLLVAELWVWEVNEYGYQDFYIVEDARTWTKYRVYMGTVDADGDGYDDRTGLPVNQPEPEDEIRDGKPNKDDYEDDILGRLSYYFDTFIYYITMPFTFIGDIFRNILNWILDTVDGWINSFVRVFEVLFNFLPKEIVMMLGLGFATLMIITIIKAIRG